MAEKRLIDAMQTVIKMSGRITPLIQMGANPAQVYNEVLQVVAEAPTVDAVEVVRCCDCKYSTPPSLVTQKYGVPGTLTCHNHNGPCNKRNVKGEGFCSYGERKDGLL